MPVTANVVNCTPANTPPTITITGVSEGGEYNKGSVPAAMCQVTDKEDGEKTFAASLSAVTGPYASDGIGSQTASCSYTDAGGLTASASTTYSIIDPSAPYITYSLNPAAPDGDNGWYVGDVTVSWAVVDNESTVTTTGCEPAVINTDTTGTTLTCSAVSAGGQASESVTIKRDETKPAIDGSASPAATNGWNNTDVTVSFSCSDATSGVASCTSDVTLSGEGAGQSVTGTAIDHAGNSESDTVSGINIDKTAPTANATVSPGPNANGWNNGPVTVAFSGSDGLSGVDFCDPDVLLSSEGAGQSASGTCTDKAGNVSDPAPANNINIDLTKPTVALVGGPAAGGTYYFGFVPAAPTCDASDALSGLDSCTVTGYSSAVGTHTVTATAADKAGNTNSASATYTVSAWTLYGFYKPVDMDGVYNLVKGGSTVPLKFEVFAGDTELTSTSVVKSFVQTKIACDGSAPTDEIEVTTTGGTSLRYDTVGGQFIQNWQTPKTPGVCYRVTMTTQDNSSLVAFFRLK